MQLHHNGRKGKWAAGIGALVLASGLVASLSLGATSASAASDWDGNGAPPFLKTAPTGTPLTGPAKNTFFPCQLTIPIPGKEGMTGTIGKTVATQLVQAQTPWVQDGKVIISKIETVPGKVKRKSIFKVTENKTTRHLKGNGIPSTPMGIFPIPSNSAAYSYYAALPAQGYANAAEIPVKEWDLDVTLPMNPKVSAKPHCIPSLMTGITLTGAAWHAEVAPDSKMNLYDPNAALPTDSCFGHPYVGEYHYHGYSWKCMEQGKAGEQSPLVGYAMDGFGVYGPRGADGKVVTNAKLDECHGTVSEVMFNGKMQKIYHYVLNNEYPYSIGCFRGTPQIPMKGMSQVPKL